MLTEAKLVLEPEPPVVGVFLLILSLLLLFLLALEPELAIPDDGLEPELELPEPVVTLLPEPDLFEPDCDEIEADVDPL